MNTLERRRLVGTVVQAGSALSQRGIPLQSAYCGAKHAIQGFNESLRCELLHDGSGVHVTMVQMPAVNTPQFSWVRSKLPRQAQPVPPIFEPEVAARAVLWAANHPQRREYWVGGPTVATLVANAIAPGKRPRTTLTPSLAFKGGKPWMTFGTMGGDHIATEKVIEAWEAGRDPIWRRDPIHNGIDTREE